MSDSSNKPSSVEEAKHSYGLVSAATCDVVRQGLSRQIDKITEKFAHHHVPRPEVRMLVLDFIASALHQVSRGRCQRFEELNKVEWEQLMDKLSGMRAVVEAQLQERYARKDE